VGGSRLTAVGTILAIGVLAGVMSPPPATDRQILVLVWASMVAAVVIGVAWPLIAVRRVAVAVGSPRDATVGEDVPLEVTVTGRLATCEVRALDPTGPWYRVASGSTGVLGHLADRRGVFRAVRFEVRSSAPLGIVSARRVLEAPIGHVVEVAPKPLAVDWVSAPAPIEGGADEVALAALGGDLVRSTRPYVSGDPAHLVHWPSTARTGTLVVREFEPPAHTGQALVVDLRGLGEDRERAASYALGAARAVLAAGGELVLCTAEASGPVTARVGTPLEAGRRLARAVSGEPGAAPDGWPVVEIGR
jgi:uncharacterized protein (DUF58 family)